MSWTSVMFIRVLEDMVSTAELPLTVEEEIYTGLD